MSFLYEKLDVLRDTQCGYAELPRYIQEGLSGKFDLREYQTAAFRHFITYFENSTFRTTPAQALFHMATGSGKTLIMAGLILYLYQKGYRNFLFFVNSKNIIEKTRHNFIRESSPKYLFQSPLILDGCTVPMKIVTNFQQADKDAVNLQFATIQGLYTLLNNPRENSVTYDDFEEQKTVLISDEAHHLNVETKTGKLGKNETENKANWEACIRNIFAKNNDNVLLEFTATCDLSNPFIKQKYEDKIVFNYPLKQFRKDRFSKEIHLFQFDGTDSDRSLAACILSQYRFKVFQHQQFDIKPVILFKSKDIAGSKAFYEEFHAALAALTDKKIMQLRRQFNNELWNSAFRYFDEQNINYKMFAEELKEEFGIDRSLVINSKEESENTRKQIWVNTLEERNNPYRAIFAVDMLNEGWDVLNLFDIVRTFESRDSKGGKPGKTTIAEAQLIGRGARYCPFEPLSGGEKYKRKFDHDLRHPLRICETLCYHSKKDNKYIQELTAALQEIGLYEPHEEIEFLLKDNFKQTKFYLEGHVYANRQVEADIEPDDALAAKIQSELYRVSVASYQATLNFPFATEERVQQDSRPKQNYPYQLSTMAYPVIHKAARQFPQFDFDRLKKYFPKLTTLREFLTAEGYLGKVKFVIESTEEESDLTAAMLYEACFGVMRQIAMKIGHLEKRYVGTQQFYPKQVRHTFTDRRVRKDGKIKLPALDIQQADWFVYNSFAGTSEENQFLEDFHACWYTPLKAVNDEVYLIRNERQLKIYDYDTGQGFEPDFVLILKKEGRKQMYQIFIEPKGGHLEEYDRWKNQFLKQIFFDGADYRVIGLPFYNAGYCSVNTVFEKELMKIAKMSAADDENLL